MEKRKIICFIVILLAVVLFIAALFICHNGYTIALQRAGFGKDGATTIDAGIDDNGDAYRVVFQYAPDNTIRIAHFTKGKLGSWKVTNAVYGPSSESPLVKMGWMRVASLRRFDIPDEVTADFETHNVYAGNNAVRQIEIPPELLPPNVAVSIHQAGSCFVLHFVSFGDPEILNQMDITALLTETNSISN